MNSIRFWLISLTLSAFIFTACDDDPDDPDIPNEEELITTLTYTLTPEGGGSPVVFSFRDTDGDGGSDPTIQTSTLAANTNYEGDIILLNELEDPAENITEEVDEEDEEHQFFYQTTVSGLTITYDDADEEGNPVGIETDVSTGAADSGTLTITLRHEPDKSADGVADGELANAGGETDIEVTFNVNVQ